MLLKSNEAVDRHDPACWCLFVVLPLLFYQVTSMSIFGMGLPELVVIGVIAVVIFGPKKLPELGSSIGKALKGFKDEMGQSSGSETAGSSETTQSGATSKSASSPDAPETPDRKETVAESSPTQDMS